jgi:hypothetical protein
MPIVFISYRREDSTGYAGRLHEELEQRLGASEVFRDVDTLRPGQDFVEAIEHRLQNCGTLVALIGRTWLTATDESGARRIDQPGDYVAMEIGEALSRRDVLVVPVLVGGAVMPTPQQLPERLKNLGRKQALVVRDETWEQDVDRLAAILLASSGKSAAPAARTARRAMPAAMWVAVALILATMAIVAVVALREPSTSPDLAAVADGPPAAVATGAGATEAAASGAGATAPGPPVAVGSVFAIGVPGNPEFSTAEAVFTVLTGSLVNRGTTNTLWLRVRGSNEGRYAVGLSSDAFRLAAGNELLVPTSFFSEVLDAHSIKQKLVSFDVPPGPGRAELRITMGPDTGAIPIDLRPSGQPATHEQPDTSDALSRASVSTITRDPRLLIAENDLTATILHITDRRFVNKHRLTIALRYENNGRYHRGTGELALRLANGADAVAPTRAPSESVPSMTTFTGDVVFELPPDAKTVTLRAMSGQRQSELPLKLP